ncbi:hypothetical protein SNEBB_009011 [Seison nebaliae]|nr:hypothetical protein SNEBB_009011 [Seison nebaliae]
MTSENTSVSVLVPGKMYKKKHFVPVTDECDKIDYVCVELNDSDDSDTENGEYSCSTTNRFDLLKKLNALKDINEDKKKDKKNQQHSQKPFPINDQKISNKRSAKTDRHSGSHTTIKPPNKRGGDGPYNFGDPQKSQIDGLNDLEHALQHDKEENETEKKTGQLEDGTLEQKGETLTERMTLTEFMATGRAEWLSLSEMANVPKKKKTTNYSDPSDFLKFKSYKDNYLKRNGQKNQKPYNRQTKVPSEFDVGSLGDSDFPNLGVDVPSKTKKKYHQIQHKNNFNTPKNRYSQNSGNA